MTLTISFTDNDGDKVEFDRYEDGETIITVTNGDRSMNALLDRTQLAALRDFVSESEKNVAAQRPGYIVRSEA